MKRNLNKNRVRKHEGRALVSLTIAADPPERKRVSSWHSHNNLPTACSRRGTTTPPQPSPISFSNLIKADLPFVTSDASQFTCPELQFLCSSRINLFWIVKDLAISFLRSTIWIYSHTHNVCAFLIKTKE